MNADGRYMKSDHRYLKFELDLALTRTYFATYGQEYVNPGQLYIEWLQEGDLRVLLAS